MASGIFGIGASGLHAAQAGLATTGHNIANANTPGYHRQQILQSNATPHYTGSGFIGSGVEVDTVRRVYNDYLETQVGRSQSQASYYSTYFAQVSQIENLLANPSAGLTPALQAFFEGVHEVAANPGAAPSRQAMLATAQSLATRFQTLDGRLREIGAGVNAQIESSVATINSYAQQIASLNARITTAQVTPGQPANDLLDQRGHLISELNKLIGATAIYQADGNATVSIGSGQALVVGTQAYALEAVASPDTPGRTEVSYVVGASSIIMPARTITGGTLGALLSFREGTLAQAQNDLGLVAAGLAESFNAQHRLGQDVRGALGGDFFTPPQPLVTGHRSNGGNADIGASISSASALTASDYRVLYSGGTYTVTRLSDNTSQSFAGLPQTVDGITLQLNAGAPSDGDSFLIQPTVNAARDFNLAFRDPALIAAAAPIRTGSSSANVGNASISAGVVNAPLDANVQQPVTITFTSATTFDVTGAGTGNPVGLVYTPGADITYNGWTVSISGTPAAGDTFTITQNTNGTADSRNALLLGELHGANTLKGGTATYTGAYGQLTSSVGNTVRDMEVASSAQDAIAMRAREAQQSISGVNLDEEAANLLRYQQAYQASSKVIQIASQIFQTILDIG